MRLAEASGEVRRLLTARLVQTVLVGALAAAMVLSVLLTVGRTIALEQIVQARTETSEARTVLISDTGTEGLIQPETVRILARMDGVSQVIATATPVDGVNFHLGEGSNRIPVWGVVGDLSDVVVLRSGRMPGLGEALVSESALDEVSMASPAGALVLTDGHELPVVGTFEPRPPFGEMEAGAVWMLPTEAQGLRRLYVVAVSVAHIDSVTGAALGLFDSTKLGDLRVERSAAIAELQQLLAGDLSQFGRELVGLVLVAGMLLVALVLFAEVLTRRKDLGRQRALGARRSTVILLLAGRTGASATIGALLGLAGGLLYLSHLGAMPTASFAAGLVVLAILAPILAAVLPAWWAARRDPVLELRTP